MYTTRRILPLCLFLFLLYRPMAFAHTHDSLCASGCHCSNLVIPAGIMTGHVHDKNEWMISYRYMDMQMSGTISGTSAVPEENIFAAYLVAPDEMQMNMHMLMAMYGVTNRLTLMVMAQFNSTDMKMTMFSTGSHHHGGENGETGHHMHTSGLGDVKLSALFGLVKTSRCQFIALFGVNIPTGSINKKGNSTDMLYAEKHLPYNMQLGSGTLDLMPGIGYLYQHGDFSYGAQALAVIRPHYNHHHYRWGNEWGLNTWIARQWWSFLGTSLRFEGNLIGNLQGMDPSLYWYNEPAANPNNYGGRKLNAFAGLSLKVPKGTLSNQSLSFEYGLPLYQNLNGIQMPNKQMVNAAWSITF